MDAVFKCAPQQMFHGKTLTKKESYRLRVRFLSKSLQHTCHYCSPYCNPIITDYQIMMSHIFLFYFPVCSVLHHTSCLGSTPPPSPFHMSALPCLCVYRAKLAVVLLT